MIPQAIKQAMAKKFNLPEQAMAKKFNLPEEDFIDFPMGDKTVVMHGKNGIYKGSYNKIMKDSAKDWRVMIGGKGYDTRKYMTSEVFAAFIDYCKTQKISPLPYSIDSESDYWPWCLMTGDELTAVGDVPIRDVREGGVRGHVYGPDVGDRDVRVCPAVVIDTMDLKVDVSSEISSVSLTEQLTNYLFERGHLINKPLVDDIATFIKEELK